MYCKNCGCSLPDDATKCENCGAVLSYGFEAGKTIPVKEEKGSVLLGILGFMFPLIGLILYLAMMHSEPKKAKSAGKGALTAFIIYLVFKIHSSPSYLPSIVIVHPLGSFHFFIIFLIIALIEVLRYIELLVQQSHSPGNTTKS